MTDKSLSEQLQKSIVVYSAIGTLAIGVIIALVSIVPLFNNLKGKIDRDQLFAVKTRTMAVEEYLTRAKDIAFQVTSRTRIRDYLGAYNRGKIGLDELVDFTVPKLADAMNLSEEVEGISRLDHKASLVAQVGLPIPEELRQVPHGESREAIMHGPIALGGNSYFIVGAPILDRQSRRVGTDILLFKLTRLQRIVKDYTGLGETGEIVLGAVRDHRVQPFFPLRGSKGAAPGSLPMKSPLGTAFKKAVRQEAGILKPSGSHEVIAYGPVQGCDWGVAVKMNKEELYAPVKHQIVVTGGIASFLILLGTCIMVILFRPLTGRMVVLEQDIRTKTLALEGELNQRKRAEDHILYIQGILKAIRDVNQLIVHEKDQKKLLQRACEILNQTWNYKMVWIGLVNDENKDVLPVAQAGFEEGYLKSAKITWDDSETGKGPTGKAIKTRKPFIMQDIAKDPLYKPWQKKAIKRGYGSSTAIPLVYEDRLFGALNVYAAICDAFDEEEMDLLSEVGRDLAFALKTIEMEKEIKETKEFLQSIIDNASDLICTVDLEGNFLSINRAVTEQLGYEKEDLIGKPKALLAVDPELFMNTFRQVFEKGRLSNLEVPFKRKDGTIADLLYSVTLLRDKDGHPVAVAGFGKDITERKRAEQIQKVLFNISNTVNTSENLDELIRDIRKHLGTLIDTSNFFIALYEEEIDTISLPYFYDQKDKYSSLPAGKTLVAYIIKTKKPLLATKEMISELERSGEVETIGSASEVWLGVPLILKGKVTGALVVQSYEDENAFSEKDKKMLEFISEQISISIERKKAEQALQKYREQLEELIKERTKELEEKTKKLKQANIRLQEMDRLKSEFIATMSHELRTPLNSIIGFTGIILKGITGKINQEQRKQLSMVYNSAKHLLNLINEILDLSRIESGKMEVSVERFKIKEVISQATLSLSPMISQKDLKLVKNIPHEIPEIYSDKKKIFQILLNLVNNAAKFTDKGEIKIECKTENNNLKVCVSDTGIGVKKKDMNYLFEAFRQIDGRAQRRYEGAGLGLHLCKKLVTVLGGKIRAESEYGKGSRFTFILPLRLKKGGTA